MQIFAVVTYATLAGKLTPGAPRLKLKQSSEAAGSNHFPPLAYINVFTVIAATGLYAFLVVPGPGLQPEVYNYVVCGSRLLLIWFGNWVSNKLACNLVHLGQEMYIYVLRQWITSQYCMSIGLTSKHSINITASTSISYSICIWTIYVSH